MTDDVLSRDEIDSLLAGVQGMSLSEYRLMEDSPMDINEGVAEFSIQCGDWLYPSKDSNSRVPYPIDKPLVLMLFPTEGVHHTVDPRSGDISSHLRNSRRLHCTIDLKSDVLTLRKLTNDQEPDFEHDLSTLNLGFLFNRSTLARKSDFTLDDFSRNSCANLSVLVSSILLQDYVAAPDLDWGIPNRLYFRDATYPEIESIGRW